MALVVKSAISIPIFLLDRRVKEQGRERGKKKVLSYPGECHKNVSATTGGADWRRFARRVTAVRLENCRFASS